MGGTRSRAVIIAVFALLAVALAGCSSSSGTTIGLPSPGDGTAGLSIETQGEILGQQAYSPLDSSTPSSQSLSGWTDTVGCPAAAVTAAQQDVTAGTTVSVLDPTATFGPLALPKLNAGTHPSCAFRLDKATPPTDSAILEVFFGMSQHYAAAFGARLEAAGFADSSTDSYRTKYLNGGSEVVVQWVASTDGGQGEVDVIG